MMKPVVLVTLLDPGLNGVAGLSIADPYTFTNNAVYTRYFQANVILNGAKETGNLPRQEAYSFEVIF
jgi:hypothetical protein